MSKILFLESVAGIAGDMFAASFVDAGLVTSQEIAALPEKLGLKDVTVEITSVTKATMKATHLLVKEPSSHHHHNEHHHEHSHEHHHHEHSHIALSVPPAVAGGSVSTHSSVTSSSSHHHAHYKDIDEMIKRSSLDDETKNMARKIFRLIAEAESDAHGIEIEKVAFHEVGMIDSIVDVVAAAFCISKVNATQIYATPVKVGRGLIKIQHGVHPVPPPASARLLIGLPVAKTPEAITRENVELSTPTGIAILKALNPTFVNEIPVGKVTHQGMGAGTMDLKNYPNVFRLTVLESDATELPYERDEVIEISCNIDDDTAERIAWITEQLHEQGALDVWLTPVTAKKGRAAVCLTLLATEGDWQLLADWLLRNSTTFGVRYRKWDRLKLVREFENRTTQQGEVTYKIGLTTSNEVLKEKAEYETIRHIWEDGVKNR